MVAAKPWFAPIPGIAVCASVLGWLAVMDVHAVPTSIAIPTLVDGEVG